MSCFSLLSLGLWVSVGRPNRLPCSWLGATDPEDVFHAESGVVEPRPDVRELVAERVLGVSAAGVDGDVLMAAGATQRPHQRPRVALIGDDVHVPRSTVAQVLLQLRQRVSLVVRRLRVRGRQLYRPSGRRTETCTGRVGALLIRHNVREKSGRTERRIDTEPLLYDYRCGLSHCNKQ